MARASTRCAAAAKSHPTPEPRTRTRRRARARTRTRSRCGAAARRLRSALTPRCTRCSTRTPTTYASTTAPTSRASCAEPRRRCCKSWGCRPDRSGKARQRPAGGIALLRLAAIYDSIRRGSPVVRCVNICIPTPYSYARECVLVCRRYDPCLGLRINNNNNSSLPPTRILPEVREFGS